MITVSKENIERWRGLRAPGNPPWFKPLWASWVCWGKGHDWRVHIIWPIFEAAGIVCDRCYQSTHIHGTFDKDERVLLEERRIGWGNIMFSIFFVGVSLFVTAMIVAAILA